MAQWIGIGLAGVNRAKRAPAHVHKKLRKHWRAVATIAALAVLGVLFAAAHISLRTVSRDGVDCGSALKPIDAEAFGPAGTNPRPCSGAHDADAVVALALVAVAGVVVVVVVRSRPGRATETPEPATGQSAS
jgi:membrane protease YdiL (CAAX protease family)